MRSGESPVIGSHARWAATIQYQNDSHSLDAPALPALAVTVLVLAGLGASIGLAVGFRYAPTRATRGDRRRSLIEFLIATASACSSNFVALLIDEAQAMTFREWNWLLGLQNAMDWEGYRFSVFSCERLSKSA